MALLLPFHRHENSSTPGTIALFGIQYTSLTPTKRTQIATLGELLASSPSHVDQHLLPQRPGGTSPSCTTFIFVSYWLSDPEYRAWWTSGPVQEFWSALPDDAGVWREVLTVSSGRFLHGTSQTKRLGFGAVRGLEGLELEFPPPGEKYWGRYRTRLPEHHDDGFESPFASSPDAESGTEKPTVTLTDPTGEAKGVRRGRVLLPEGFDNMVWVREYQDLSGMGDAERELWDERIGPHADSWIQYLDTKRNQNGILSFRTTAAVGDAAIAGNEDSTIETAEKTFDQFGYYLDLAHFEKSGKSYLDHFKARSGFEKLYGPGGELEGGKGDVHLMVELAVLKKENVRAEYIGCVEGTGLMEYEQVLGK
jgi:Haem-containing dehydratase